VRLVWFIYQLAESNGFTDYSGMESLDPSLKNAPVAQIIFPKKSTISFIGLVEYGTLGRIPKRLRNVIFEAPTAPQLYALDLEGSDDERHEETQNQPPQTGVTAIATGTDEMGGDIVLHDPLPPLASSRKRRRPTMDEGSRKKRAVTPNGSDLVILQC